MINTHIPTELISLIILEIRVSQNFAKLGGGGGGRPIKCQGWKGVEKNWSKLCSLGGRVFNTGSNIGM